MSDPPPAYIIVCDKESGTPTELPLDAQGHLPVTTLQIEFTGASGIKYRNPATGIYRIIAPNSDATLSPPPGGWGNHHFVACLPKAVEDRPWAQPSPSVPPTDVYGAPPAKMKAMSGPPMPRGAMSRGAGPPGRGRVLSSPRGRGGPPRGASSTPAAHPTPRQYDYCELCQVSLNGPAQAETHYSGRKHKEKVDGGGGRGRGGPPGRGRGLLMGGRTIQSAAESANSVPVGGGLPPVGGGLPPVGGGLPPVGGGVPPPGYDYTDDVPAGAQQMLGQLPGGPPKLGVGYSNAF